MYIYLEFSLFHCSTTRTQMHYKLHTLCTFFTVQLSFFLYIKLDMCCPSTPWLSRSFGGKSLVSLVFHACVSCNAPCANAAEKFVHSFKMPCVCQKQNYRMREITSVGAFAESFRSSCVREQQQQKQQPAFCRCLRTAVGSRVPSSGLDCGVVSREIRFSRSATAAAARASLLARLRAVFSLRRSQRRRQCGKVDLVWALSAKAAN